MFPFGEEAQKKWKKSKIWFCSYKIKTVKNSINFIFNIYRLCNW